MSIANTLKLIVMWLEKRFMMMFFVCFLSALSHRLLTSIQNQQTPYIVPQQNYSSPTFTALDNLIPPVIRKSTRSTKPPAYLKDFHCNVSVGIESKNSSLFKYPISSFVNYSKFFNNHKHFAFGISLIVEPKTYAQEVKHENWRKAMDG